MALPGVVGVYVGLTLDSLPCLRVMVEKRTPFLQEKIPRVIDGVPVEVEESGPIEPMK